MKTNDETTPSSMQSSFTIREVSKLVAQIKTLEAEMQEAREQAEKWRDNYRNGTTMSMIASLKLPWER